MSTNEPRRSRFGLWLRGLFASNMDVTARAPLPEPDPHPDMHPIVPPVDVESLPVSCLVKGLVKSMDVDHDKWQEIIGFRYREGFANPVQLYSRFVMVEQTLTWDADKNDCLHVCTYVPTKASNGYIFNVREKQLLVNAITLRHSRIAVKVEKLQREQAKYFEDLGCPPPPFRTKDEP